MDPRLALVVDDDPDGREGVAQLLEARGYEVSRAENGRVALDRIADRMPCLMILDLDMPVMSGWEVLAWVRGEARCASLTIVVLSAASAPPGVAFVRKPCEVALLLEAVQACEARGE